MTDDVFQRGPVALQKRRFLATLKEVPADLLRGSAIRIFQGYPKDGRETWIRIEEEAGVKKFFRMGVLTGKKEITECEFNVLWESGVSDLRKTRHIVEWSGVKLQLDVLHGKLKGHVLVDVAPDSQVPEWLGIEVTGDERYREWLLAENGIPEIH